MSGPEAQLGGDSAQSYPGQGASKASIHKPFRRGQARQGGMAVDSQTLQREGVWELVPGGGRVGEDSGPPLCQACGSGAAEGPRP